MRGILVGLGLMGLFGCTTAAAETVAGGSDGAGGAGGAGGDATSSVASGGGGSEPTTTGPYVPSVEPAGEPSCGGGAACSDDADALELLFEAPASIELRQATTNTVLGYDNAAKRYVLYSVLIDMSTLELPTVIEARRFGPEVDRVIASQNGQGLVCAGASCELWHLTDGVAMIARIPDELEPRAVGGDCVAGRGIVCRESSQGGPAWSWKLGPDALARPLTAMAFLGGEMFVASDGVGPAMIIDQGHVFPLDLGTTSPVVSLVTSPDSRQFWSGLTASSQLVVGNAGGGAACDPEVRILDHCRGLGRVTVRENTLTYGGAYCHHAHLPEGIVDVASTECGAYVRPLAIDAHRIYGRPMTCMAPPSG